jgi:hypothetical protein
VEPSAELSRAQKAAILSVQELFTKTGDRATEVLVGDKLAALKLLAQHLGLFKNVVEKTGRDGAPMMVVLSRAEANL